MINGMLALKVTFSQLKNSGKQDATRYVHQGRSYPGPDFYDLPLLWGSVQERSL